MSKSTPEPYTPTEAEIRDAWAKRNALYRSTSLAPYTGRAHVATNDALYSAEDYAEFDRFMSGYVRKPSREELSRFLQREFGSFLAHDPHNPERFWGGSADAILTLLERTDR